MSSPGCRMPRQVLQRVKATLSVAAILQIPAFLFLTRQILRSPPPGSKVTLFSDGPRCQDLNHLTFLMPLSSSFRRCPIPFFPCLQTPLTMAGLGRGLSSPADRIRGVLLSIKLSSFSQSSDASVDLCGCSRVGAARQHLYSE